MENLLKMKSSIRLKLPLPNSANSHWHHGRGITYLSKQGRDFRYLVNNIVNNANINPLTGRLFIEVFIYPRDKRKMDIDNRAKPLLDALQHAKVFIDDSQVDRLILERKEIIPGGMCEVFIQEI
jgi:crossover junction endodeoxyribonuclease RusA